MGYPQERSGNLPLLSCLCYHFSSHGDWPQTFRFRALQTIPYDRLNHKNRPISTQFQDLGRGNQGSGRAKYPYLSRLTSIGLLFVCAISFGFPATQASAFDFSYFNIPSKRVVASGVSAKPQNSQTIAFLEAVANIDPRKAMGGGDITIVDETALLPDVGPSGTIADIEANEHQGKVSLYVVRKGDTLPQIAKMFEVSLNTILWANDLNRGDYIREGQTLVILPIDGIQHTVKKGDTIQSIAKKYGGDVTEILEFNNVEVGQSLSVGDTIVVPNGRETAGEATKTTGSVQSRTISKYPAISGYYTHPVPTGRKTQGIHGYNGVDYGAPIGTPVYAAADGTVIVSKFRTLSDPWFGGYGNYIVIEHSNGTQTLYGHLSAVYVAVGAHVDQKQPIGEVGSTGKSTGPHLHFEVRGAKNPF